jgi:hypothetical protein
MVITLSCDEGLVSMVDNKYSWHTVQGSSNLLRSKYHAVSCGKLVSTGMVFLFRKESFSVCSGWGFVSDSEDPAATKVNCWPPSIVEG